VLLELSVRNLGVIEDVTIVLGPGMTALTGETGAGKTLVVEAIELLVGGRADAVLVRPGADEAWVEGRFDTPDGTEVILARAVPAAGRSRAYVDGRMAPVAALAEWGDRLVDLHGQHAHQSLLAPAVQRGALDAFGRVDRGPLEGARARVREIDEALAALGGDARARAREVDLLRFQVTELDDAGLDDPDEDTSLEQEETLLARPSTGATPRPGPTRRSTGTAGRARRSPTASRRCGLGVVGRALSPPSASGWPRWRARSPTPRPSCGPSSSGSPTTRAGWRPCRPGGSCCGSCGASTATPWAT